MGLFYLARLLERERGDKAQRNASTCEQSLAPPLSFDTTEDSAQRVSRRGRGRRRIEWVRHRGNGWWKLSKYPDWIRNISNPVARSGRASQWFWSMLNVCPIIYGDSMNSLPYLCLFISTCIDDLDEKYQQHKHTCMPPIVEQFLEISDMTQHIHMIIQLSSGSRHTHTHTHCSIVFKSVFILHSTQAIRIDSIYTIMQQIRKQQHRSSKLEAHGVVCVCVHINSTPSVAFAWDWYGTVLLKLV